MEESDHLVTMNLRVGSVLPLLNTAIGRLFLAYLAPPRRRGLSLRSAPVRWDTPRRRKRISATCCENIRARRLSHDCAAC
jgi:DNA-binding IclR family transcriptional regulator